MGSHPGICRLIHWTEPNAKHNVAIMSNPPAEHSGDKPSGDLRAILFDVFGTVVNWRGSLIDSLKRFGADRGLDFAWDSVADRWRAKYWPKMDLVRRGEIKWTILDEIHRMGLVEVLDEFNIPALPDRDIRFLTECWHRLSPWPDSVEGLLLLRKKFIIGPLSNGNLSLMVNLSKFAGLPWDVVFGCDLFRHYKPDPETYLGVCGYLNLRPDQVMLGAAHNYDLAAARKLGLRTAFIPRLTEYGSAQTTDLKAEQAWDVIASDFVDLADKLAG
jgi:2-haloacid dehalogenase